MTPSGPAAPVVRAPDPAPSVVRPAVVYVLLYVAIGAWYPYISVFYREIGLSLTQVGLLAALNAGIGLVGAPIWGAVGDRRRDLRGLLVLAGVWGAASATLLATVRDPLVVSAAVVLLAIGVCGMGPMLDSLTVETLGERRERFGRARAWGSAAFIAASLGTGLLVDLGGAVTLFAIQVPGLLGTSLAAAVLLRGGGRRRVSVGVSPLDGLVGVLRHPTLGLFLLGSVVVWTSVTAATTFVSVHIVALGGEGSVVGLVWALGALVEVPLMFAFPALARRFGDERLLVVAAAAFAVRAAAWSLVGEPALLVAAAPLGGIGFGLFYVGTVGYVARAVPAEVQATAQGIFSGTSFSTGSILGALLGGLLAGAIGIPAMFAAAAAGTCLGAALVWWAIARPGSVGAATRAAAGGGR